MVFSESCAVLELLTTEEFRLIMDKLNRLDKKLEELNRRVTSIGNRGGNGSVREVPTLPDCLKLPADTVKDLKDAASFVKQNERSARTLVSSFFTHVHSIGVRYM